ncbi:hypothetical protein F5883DRAFT_592145 [Diaporthe sp. PMI_573]|nr:hypothetical protein F5883DRAFT_592145 [Diaporthaceae sp. PMI_573]
MPLVPEPFVVTAPSPDSEAPPCVSVANKRCKFFPNLGVSQYRDLSEEKTTELDQRCHELSRRATENQSFGSSDFLWKLCAWSNVFGSIHDDENFNIDNRPYEFVEYTDINNATTKVRTPDITIGLRTHDCQSLELVNLKKMMRNSKCGLIVDGQWGEADLVFPFAVYEAKKKSTGLDAALDQVHHACRTYLAMLDDLARNPENVTEYQTEESSRYQMFAFVSWDSRWQVLVAWNEAGAYRVEKIWEGDVVDLDRASELIHIVDQIQEYATHIHRHFVMKHLEAWHARHTRTFTSSAGPTNAIGSGDTATWAIIKAQSEQLKRKRAAETRRHAKNLREVRAVRAAGGKMKKRLGGRLRRIEMRAGCKERSV